MRFYTQQHKYYCGIDLRARSMYICILDQEGNTLLHKNFKTDPESFLRLSNPIGRISSSPSSACSSGAGLPIYVTGKRFLLSLVMRYT